MNMYQELKVIWKKLGVNGQLKNFSSKELWVLDTDSGKPIARRLQAGCKTPPTTDTDAFKRVDGVTIDGHKSWWKFYDISTVEVYDQGAKLVRISAIIKTAVKENHFGEPTYLDKKYGLPIQLITDVKRNKKKQIVSYYVTQIGWVDPAQALKMTCYHEIDNARPVFPKSGMPYLRTRKDLIVANNISTKGLV